LECRGAGLSGIAAQPSMPAVVQVRDGVERKSHDRHDPADQQNGSQRAGRIPASDQCEGSADGNEDREQETQPYRQDRRLLAHVQAGACDVVAVSASRAFARRDGRPDRQGANDGGEDHQSRGGRASAGGVMRASHGPV